MDDELNTIIVQLLLQSFRAAVNNNFANYQDSVLRSNMLVVAEFDQIRYCNASCLMFATQSDHLCYRCYHCQGQTSSPPVYFLRLDIDVISQPAVKCEAIILVLIIN